MAIKIVLSKKVGVPVKGTYNDETGKAVPFDFTLVCDRLDADGVREKFPDGAVLSDAFGGITHDWKGVSDEDGKELSYSPEGLKQLFHIPGIAQIAYSAYLAHAGAKAKN